MRILFIFFIIISFLCNGQVQNLKIEVLNQRLDSIEKLKQEILVNLEGLKLEWIQGEIKKVGVPKSNEAFEIVNHSAYSLSYNEEHEQADWVMHVILPDIIYGNISRTNDFRVDSLIKSGSTEEKDYFLKKLKSDGETYTYDGFGFDRGHLAPSADFRWSQKALSESYYYSNMSPQISDFNRLKWAELESWMRDYVIVNNTHLVIVTAPILNKNLPKIERSVNGVSIPEHFVKAAIDVKNNRGIGFILRHEKIELPLESFAVSIDSVESVLGFDFFSGLDDEKEEKIESSFDYKHWLPGGEKGDILAIEQKRLPKKALSTYGIHVFVNDGKKHVVCGTVVSTKKHDKGHVFIDLDKKFPNQVFSVSIFESNITNFDYKPEIYLKDKEVCFTGEIGEYNGTPNMVIDNGKQIKLLEDH
ncbi:MAG: DNA/RNA non-specific endonuclease [Crocinitomicaceae bacterium]